MGAMEYSTGLGLKSHRTRKEMMKLAPNLRLICSCFLSAILNPESIRFFQVSTLSLASQSSLIYNTLVLIIAIIQMDFVDLARQLVGTVGAVKGKRDSLLAGVQTERNEVKKIEAELKRMQERQACISGDLGNLEREREHLKEKILSAETTCSKIADMFKSLVASMRSRGREGDDDV